MTIRTICERCGKVIAYTDPNQQLFEAMTNPDQFCGCDADIEHVKAMIEEGYIVSEIAEVTNHSTEWVRARMSTTTREMNQQCKYKHFRNMRLMQLKT